jgi:hypothetical protein
LLCIFLGPLCQIVFDESVAATTLSESEFRKAHQAYLAQSGEETQPATVVVEQRQARPRASSRKNDSAPASASTSAPAPAPPGAPNPLVPAPAPPVVAPEWAAPVTTSLAETPDTVAVVIVAELPASAQTTDSVTDTRDVVTTVEDGTDAIEYSQRGRRKKPKLGPEEECKCGCYGTYNHMSMQDCKGDGCRNRVNRTCVSKTWLCHNCANILNKGTKI